MNSVWRITLLYAAAHMAVDLTCAYTAFSQSDWGAMGFLIYNFCAFALQMPLGLLADRMRRGTPMFMLGIMLTAAICLLDSPALWTAIPLGLGNGLFHVGAGHGVLQLSRHRSAPLGVFVAPGAVGIGLGRLLGGWRNYSIPIASAVLLLGAVSLVVSRREQLPEGPPVQLPGDKSSLAPGLLLFLVVVLRSVGGMGASSDWKTGGWVIAAMAAVMAGKMAGGFAADCWGMRRAGILSLTAAAICSLWPAQPILGLLGLFFFQMTMPITLHGLAKQMPGCRAFSFGILTFALFLGFLPTWMGAAPLSGVEMGGLCLVSALLLYPALREG